MVLNAQCKAASITAAGNSRWFTTPGSREWRRLTRYESAQVMGLPRTELRTLFDGVAEADVSMAVGNGVAVEVGAAIGRSISKLWDPDWFRCNATKGTGQDQITEQVDVGQTVAAAAMLVVGRRDATLLAVHHICPH